VTRARTWAEQHQRWQPFATLIEGADDVADALEEAAFLLTLIADDHHKGWHGEVRRVMQALADAVLAATQDHVRALAIAGALDDKSNAEDQEDFVAALWRVLNAIRCAGVDAGDARNGPRHRTHRRHPSRIRAAHRKSSPRVGCLSPPRRRLR
jgi:hypothetical protein